MSDIQNTQVNGDTFQRLAADLMTFVVASITAISELSAADASVEEVQTGLLLMATLGREVGKEFALRGIVLSGGSADMVETGNDEVAADYAFDVVS